MKKIIHLLPIFLFFLSFSAAAEIAVVVSAGASTNTLDKDQVSDIFLGKSPTFPDGNEAVPVDFKEDAAIKEQFHANATGKSLAQLKAYWSKMLFSGKGTPPKEVDSAAAMIKLIAGNPNMIGYVNSSDVDSSVKVIASF